MRATQALRILADLSAPQWGMATTAQASAHGVTRHELSRLAQRGHLDRVAQGIYRDAGAPADAFEGIRAAWLGAEPARTAEERLSDLPNGVVVMGASAAALYGAWRPTGRSARTQHSHPPPDATIRGQLPPSPARPRRRDDRSGPSRHDDRTDHRGPGRGPH
ncbi:MAG: type IV toxin-antitoxin system AbiEi family antitoxin domain-containing protein [Actinobacteria bacterium]|nr:type IV toxin-antitoxin system AbiEi family antitoxin domain-containing protein [Actinomycetota bacterium]